MIIFKILGYLLGWVLSSPYSVVSLLIAPFYGICGVSFKQGCLVFTVNKIRIGYDDTVGQTLGMVVFLEEGHEDSFDHEYAHVVQFAVLGPLMAPAYGISSLIVAFTGGHWYYDNYFEVNARRYAREKAQEKV